MMFVAIVKLTVLWSWTVLHNDQDVFPKFFKPTPVILPQCMKCNTHEASIEQAMHEASPNTGSRSRCNSTVNNFHYKIHMQGG